MDDALRVLVTGSRSYTDWRNVWTRLDQLLAAHGAVVVIHGDCSRGPDRQARDWVIRRQSEFLRVAQKPHRAVWGAPCRDICDHGPRRRNSNGGSYCQAVGMYRNTAMIADCPHLALAFIGPCVSKTCHKPRPHDSHGATDCADKVTAAGIYVVQDRLIAA